MTREQLLLLLVGQAQENNFDFRKWFKIAAGIPWTGGDHAIEWLSRGQRANLLLFSHAFARAFFKSGEQVSYIVPHQTYQRVTAGGGSVTVQRKPHIRKSSRTDVWRFHLSEMATAPEPLRYIRRYLVKVEEVITEAKTAPSPQPVHDEDNTYDDELLVRDAD